MFNRTNLTLSARNRSNGLNLGTRSLALVADVNNGGRTLRTRHTHHDVLREGMVWYDVFPIMPARYGIPTDPRSFSQPQQCLPSCAPAQPGGSAAAFGVDPDLRPADLIDRPERGVEVGDPRFPSVAVAPWERRLPERPLDCESRLGGKSPRKPGWKRAAKRDRKSVV